ncbi:MAG TPA: ABC transporter substrate-binding protein, partial [Terriglobales bacterium]|nr:ABC transporter substrate-binding protein [Terriglobales bacterium]
MKKQIVWLTTILLACCSFVEAQQPAKAAPRVGFIVPAGKPSSPQLEAFRSELRELGYIEGKNIFIDRRYAEGRLDRMAGLVNDLVQQRVDLIVAPNNVAIQAARKATRSIPVIIVSSIDPVGAGYVKSFTDPGGNMTGFATINRELSAKRVELLTELLPKISRVGVLWDADGPGPRIAFKNYEAAAQAFNLDLRSLGVRGPKPDLEKAFEGAKAARAEALIVVINPLISQHANDIFKLAVKNRLASMTEEGQFVDAGGLISYGANLAELYRRAATYVDKILKGAKPADLPVEEPNRFELILNLKTAKQIGLTIPQNVLGRA